MCRRPPLCGLVDGGIVGILENGLGKSIDLVLQAQVLVLGELSFRFQPGDLVVHACLACRELGVALVEQFLLVADGGLVLFDLLGNLGQLGALVFQILEPLSRRLALGLGIAYQVGVGRQPAPPQSFDAALVTPSLIASLRRRE